MSFKHVFIIIAGGIAATFFIASCSLYANAGNFDSDGLYVVKENDRESVIQTYKDLGFRPAPFPPDFTEADKAMGGAVLDSICKAKYGPLSSSLGIWFTPEGDRNNICTPGAPSPPELAASVCERLGMRFYSSEPKDWEFVCRGV